jgi:hypothetical protein
MKNINISSVLFPDEMKGVMARANDAKRGQLDRGRLRSGETSRGDKTPS